MSAKCLRAQRAWIFSYCGLGEYNLLSLNIHLERKSPQLVETWAQLYDNYTAKASRFYCLSLNLFGWPFFSFISRHPSSFLPLRHTTHTECFVEPNFIRVSSEQQKELIYRFWKGDMDAETYTDSMNLKVRELLKEVKFDYSPSTTKLLDDVVSSIKEAIDKIPEDLQVSLSLSKTLNPPFVARDTCYP